MGRLRPALQCPVSNFAFFFFFFWGGGGERKHFFFGGGFPIDNGILPTGVSLLHWFDRCLPSSHGSKTSLPLGLEGCSHPLTKLRTLALGFFCFLAVFEATLTFFLRTPHPRSLSKGNQEGCHCHFEGQPVSPSSFFSENH